MEKNSSSKNEKKGLQKGNKTPNALGFGDDSADQKTGGRAGGGGCTVKDVEILFLQRSDS